MHVRYLLIVTALAMASVQARAQERSLKEQFIADYSQGFQRLEKFYRNVDMTEESSGPGIDFHYGGTILFRWRSTGEKFRDDVITQEGVISQSRMSRGDLTCRIYASSTTSAANRVKMAKVQSGDNYIITDYTPEANSSLIGVVRMVTPRLASSAYCVYDSTIMDLIKQDIVNVTSIDEPAPGRVRMKYTVTLPTGKSYESEFLFDKERSWAMISHRSPRLLTEVEYGDTKNGVPIATRLTHYWNGDFTKPAVVSVLKEVKPGAAPESIYSLAEFGLPELPAPKKSGFPLLTTLGASGVLLALVLGWAIRKRKNSIARAEP